MTSKSGPTWLEVSFTVDGEMAEAVAEVLSRYAPSGVVIESTTIHDDPSHVGYPEGSLRVYAYLPIDASLDETRRQLDEALWYMGRIRPMPQAEFKPIHEEDWAEAWKQHYHPIPIGRSLIIVPAWLESPDDSRRSIRIDPGIAFGTGTHPTTQLCLEMLEDYVPVGETVMDVGCGSGILSIAALKLGAGRALGVDTDPRAVEVSQENASGNGVGERMELAVGSVVDIKAGAFDIQVAPLIIANIIAPVLMRLLEAGIGDILAHKGVLILSGLIDEQVPDMLDALNSHGLRVIDQRQIEDWVALGVCKEGDVGE
jgi:ribosomal protein L11 methyltransferase